MSNTQMYKTHAIEARCNGRFYIHGKNDDELFNVAGYATLNNAKGAITKHLQAQGVEKPSKALQASNDDKSYAAMEIETERAVEAVKGIAEASYNMQSRNKREGCYEGKVSGKDKRQGWEKVCNLPRTRKQWKLSAIRYKNTDI